MYEMFETDKKFIGGKDMVILSQDKQTVVNFDNVESLEVFERTDGHAVIEVKYIDKTCAEIAEYSSVQRGKEIISNIFNGYRGGASYAMPQNWEVRRIGSCV